jgi:predicted aconitase with swiveling domain
MSKGIDQISEEVYYQSPGAARARIIVEREGITVLGGIKHEDYAGALTDESVEPCGSCLRARR